MKARTELISSMRTSSSTIQKRKFTIISKGKHFGKVFNSVTVHQNNGRSESLYAWNHTPETLVSNMKQLFK